MASTPVDASLIGEPTFYYCNVSNLLMNTEPDLRVLFNVSNYRSGSVIVTVIRLSKNACVEFAQGTRF